MKKIIERPINYDNLNNLDMRSLFEDEEYEPLIFQQFKASGNVSNLQDNNNEDTFAIDVYDEDGEIEMYSFLYSSQFEYEEDCKILGIGKFAERYKITARITGQEHILDLQKFELNNFRDESDYVGEKEFDSEQESKEHLISVAKKYYDREEYSNILDNELAKIEVLSALQIRKVWANIEKIEVDNEVGAM